MSRGVNVIPMWIIMDCGMGVAVINIHIEFVDSKRLEVVALGKVSKSYVLFERSGKRIGYASLCMSDHVAKFLVG